ncbi:hypothetical protein GW17_00024441 [Ensete ventricosum]|nr:hypothetical protein GW17_00024441 [Ensete ventricosum]
MSCFPCLSPRRRETSSRIEDSASAQSGSRFLGDSSGGGKKASLPGGETSKCARSFTFRDLAVATQNFREANLIGEGGFGRVVAIKQLNRDGLQGNKEFLVEVLMLIVLRHPNLVSLIGYCADGDERLLVYEYMPKGSLEDHLFGKKLFYSFSRPFLGDRRKFHQLADPFLQGRYPPRPFHQLVVIASMCLQEQPHVRPIITDVVVALNHVASQPYTSAPDSKIMSSPPPPLPSSGRVTARGRFVVLQDPALVDQPLLLHGHVAAPGDHGLERLDRRVDRRLDGELGAVGAAYVNGGGGRPATVVGIAVVGHGRRRPGLGDRGIPNTTAISDGERERVKKREEDGMADDGDQDWGIVESLTQPRVVSDGERERVKKREGGGGYFPSSLQLTTAAFGPVGGDDARDVGAGGRGGVGVTGVGARLDLATGGGRVADEEAPWARRRRRALRLPHGLMAVQPGRVQHQVTALGGDALGARGGGAAEDSPVGGGAAVAGDAAISGGGVTAAGEAQTVVQGIVGNGR